MKIRTILGILSTLIFIFLSGCLFSQAQINPTIDTNKYADPQNMDVVYTAEAKCSIGEDAMYKTIYAGITYSDEAKKANIKDEVLVSFIRPGLVYTLIDFEIPSDRQPLVTFSITDPGGLPLDRAGILTPGPIDLRFILSYIPAGETQKINYHGVGGRDLRGGDAHAVARDVQPVGDVGVRVLLERQPDVQSEGEDDSRGQSPDSGTDDQYIKGFICFHRDLNWIGRQPPAKGRDFRMRASFRGADRTIRKGMTTSAISHGFYGRIPPGRARRRRR